MGASKPALKDRDKWLDPDDEDLEMEDIPSTDVQVEVSSYLLQL